MIMSSHTAESIVEESGKSLFQDKTLPISIFNNEDVFDHELKSVFYYPWQYLGHESEIPDPGDYVKRYIARDPVILVRDEEGDINVFYDSCRHRGSEVCQSEKGNTSHFRCPYHGWTYKNTGELIGIPERPRVYDKLDESEWGLISLPKVDSYAGLIFASLDADAPSLEAYLGDATWYIDLYCNFTEQGMEVIGDPMRSQVELNWKTGAENQSGDWYHAPVTHKSHQEVGIDQEGEDKRLDYDEELKVRQIGDVGRWAGVISLYRDLERDAGLSQYPTEVQNSLNPNLSEGQLSCLRSLRSNVSTLFPNLTFFHLANDNNFKAEDVKRYVLLRVWRPMSPTRTEYWQWVLVPSEAPEEYKHNVYEKAAAWDGSSGMVEQDDIAVMEGITGVAGSTLAQENTLKLNYQMGTEKASGTIVVDDDWPGPGEVHSELNEQYARTFYRNWHEMMDQRIKADGDR